MEIRPPLLAERSFVEEVHLRAFPTDLEARLVELLVARGNDTISLVATMASAIVGHVVFSPATCEGESGVSTGLGLGPLAVRPDLQRRGIGIELVRAGIAAAAELQSPWIVVVGEPTYYGRFGFEPASQYGLTGEFGGNDAFQILILDQQCRPAIGGFVRYAAEFRQIVGEHS
jgi:putative acetyltransferase